MSSAPSITPPVTWVTAYLDTRRAAATAAEEFWLRVVGGTPSGRRGERGEFVTLLPASGHAVLRSQTVGVQQHDLHLDLHTDDVPGLAEHAASLGAATDPRPTHVVCSSPGGMPFCVVPAQGCEDPPAPAGPPGARTLVDQVCLDIPPNAYADEVAFWQRLTGWERYAAGEFERLTRPPHVPVAFLLQRLGDVEHRVRAHLDLSGDDRDAAAALHEAWGARVVRRREGWTVMQDPTGRVYCNTTRHPGEV